MKGENQEKREITSWKKRRKLVRQAKRNIVIKGLGRVKVSGVALSCWEFLGVFWWLEGAMFLPTTNYLHRTELFPP